MCFIKYNHDKYWKNFFNAKNSTGIRKIFAFLYIKRIEKKYGGVIPISANIASSITLPHALCGVFISKGATIGENCTIFQQVTIGSNQLKGSKGFGYPLLGDNVYIGAGAKIIGNVRIGNNVRIGANCVITKDIPDNCTVVLPENRVIMHKKGGF